MALNFKNAYGRMALAEIGRGLLFSWWVMFLLELIQPGLVSLYWDINLILALAIVSFFLGKTEIKQPGWFTVGQSVFSAILIVCLIVKLIIR